MLTANGCFKARGHQQRSPNHRRKRAPRWGNVRSLGNVNETVSDNNVTFKSQHTWEESDFKPVGNEPGITEEHLSAYFRALFLHAAQGFGVFGSS